MSASRVRARLRKARQQQNRAFLSAEQKQGHPIAAEQFTIFGRMHQGRYYKVTFQDFVARSSAPKPHKRSRGFGSYAMAARAFARRVFRRRATNKQCRKQRPYRFFGKQAKPASPV